MSLEAGMANQYIRDLSVNSRRGVRTRIENGWFPHKAPIGYLNNKYKLSDLPPIYNDPERFEILKQLWKTLIEEKCTLMSLYRKALDMGLTSSDSKKLPRSKFYLIFRNPFYYGYFREKDKIYPGKHEPMISKAEFDLAQDILGVERNNCDNKTLFAFTGLLRCGECGASITAETKIKRQKNGNVHKYAYYHCTR